MIGFPWSLYLFTYNISLVWWEINSKHWISTTANQKKFKISRNEHVMWTCLRRPLSYRNQSIDLQRANQWTGFYMIMASVMKELIFDQWKTFSENYKPMRVWLWLVYKFTENYCPSRFFSEFIQTQKRYPISPDKIRILTWKLLVISGWIFLVN